MKEGARTELGVIKRAYRETFFRDPSFAVTHLLEWVEEQRKNLHDKAEREPDANISNNLIKEAKGLYSVIEHINSMVQESKVTNRNE